MTILFVIYEFPFVSITIVIGHTSITISFASPVFSLINYSIESLVGTMPMLDPLLEFTIVPISMPVSEFTLAMFPIILPLALVEPFAIGIGHCAMAVPFAIYHLAHVNVPVGMTDLLREHAPTRTDLFRRCRNDYYMLRYVKYISLLCLFATLT